MTASPESLEAELARLRAENAVLRETLDTLDGGVVVYDRDRRYRFGNRPYHALFPHLPPDEQLAGRRYEEVLGLSIDAGSVKDPQAYADRAGFVARRIREVMDRAAPAAQEVLDPATGRWSLVRTCWTPSGNRVALRIDITELKRLQEELLRARHMETIGRISGGVAHDFNNLLTVVISNLEMLRDQLDDPVRRGLAAGALAAAESGARLTRQLLTFARRDVTRPRLLDANALLAGMRDLLQRAIGPEIGFALALDPALPPARFDAAPFEAAVLNLVLNARHAVAASGHSGHITVATCHEQGPKGSGPGGGRVAVLVSDTGCGMPPEVAAQAFEPFFTTRQPGSGSGLGLAQVWGFAAGAGGSASIDSTPGLGTTVAIRLPVAGPADAPAPPSPSPPPPASPSRNGRIVLVVEDDEAVLFTTEMILRNLGYEVLSACGAEEALRLLHRSGPIDVLFSDIAMPGEMSGIGLAAEARACRPHIKVLLTSGYPAGALGPDAEELRDVDILPKPYRRADLQVRLRQVLGE